MPLHFALVMMDALRQQAGRIADLTGARPLETQWREAARFPGGRLRTYGGDGPALLIVPVPFKRAYILMPEVSVVQAALRGGLKVYLLEGCGQARRSGASSWRTTRCACLKRRSARSSGRPAQRR